MPSRTDLVDLMLHVHHETKAALLVSDDGEEDNAVWVPKSQVRYEDDLPVPVGQDGVITVPVWLARDKELI